MRKMYIKPSIDVVRQAYATNVMLEVISMPITTTPGTIQESKPGGSLGEGGTEVWGDAWGDPNSNW